MNYLKITNNGLIDVEALRLLGASVKGKNSIGRFGSGNKFALAYLLRNNFEVIVYSGERNIPITTIEKTFKDTVFNVIVIDGVETSITTEFGKDWQLWQALREIYCNAIDEGGASIEYVNTVLPEPNKTIFYIKNRTEISSFIAKFDDYFSENKKVLFECEYGKILAKSDNEKLNFYRRGIRCFETSSTSIFDYDIKDVAIDENRLVSYSWQVPSLIWNLIYKCTNKDIIKEVLVGCTKSGCVENISSDFASVSSNNMSEEFKESIKELTFAPKGMSGLISVDDIGSTTIIPNAIFEQISPIVSNGNLAKKFKIHNNSFFIDLDDTPLFTALTEKAKDFFNECNYKEPLNYTVKLARFEDKDVLGMADIANKTIVLSEICLSKGVQCIIETMIEEYIHLKYEVQDETRRFQDAAITEIVNVLKVKNAYLV